MGATKADERKALEKIRSIVEGLGDDSYIGTAFAGCFVLAEENIENDWGLSMQENARESAKEAEEANKRADEATKRAEVAEALLNAKIQSADNWCAKYHEAADHAEEFRKESSDLMEKISGMKQEIVELKAKLYDMITNGQ